jgi:hypothetical protein
MSSYEAVEKKRTVTVNPKHQNEPSTISLFNVKEYVQAFLVVTTATLFRQPSMDYGYEDEIILASHGEISVS